MRAWRNVSILIAVALLAWEAIFRFAGRNAITPPLETMAFAAELISSRRFQPHFVETAGAFALALAVAILAGFAIGFGLGVSRYWRDTFEPVLVSLYSIPKIALYPIVLLAFGIGMPAKVAFGALHGIVPIAIFTMGAVRNINPVLLRTAAVMRLSRADTIRCILLPGALPEIFTGLRIGFSLTLIGTLLGEMFASQHGIGHLLMNGIGLHNVRLITALTFILICAAVSASALLLAFDRGIRRRYA